MLVSLEHVETNLKKLYTIYNLYNKEDIEKRAKSTGSKYFNFLKTFDIKIVSKAFDEFESKSARKFPSPIDVKNKCDDIEASLSVEGAKHYGDLKHLVCEHEIYFINKGFKESQEEIDMCMSKSIDHIRENLEFDISDFNLKDLRKNANFSIKYYGVVLCPWHQGLARARHHPGGRDDFHCQEVIKHMFKKVGS